MKLGTPQSKTTKTGWLSRHLHNRGLGHQIFEAVTVGTMLPTSLLAFEDAVVINALNGFNLGGDGKIRGDEFEALKAFYSAQDASGPGGWLGAEGEGALDGFVGASHQRCNAGA